MCLVFQSDLLGHSTQRTKGPWLSATDVPGAPAVEPGEGREVSIRKILHYV